MDRGLGARKSKRWILPAAINLCLVIVCAIIFGTYAYGARAEQAQTPIEIQKEDWYELSKNGTQLNICLTENVSGYDWRYGTSNDKLVQIHEYELDDMETDDQYDPNKAKDWKLYLKPGKDEEGEVQLTFVYVKDMESDSIDTRVLKVSIRNGRMTVEEV